MRRLVATLALLATLSPSPAEACSCRPDIDLCALAEFIVAVEITTLEETEYATLIDARVLAVARGEPRQELHLEWRSSDWCNSVAPEPGDLVWVLLPDADSPRGRTCMSGIIPFARENLDEVPCDLERGSAFEAALHQAELEVHASRAGCGSCAVGADRSPDAPPLVALALLALGRRRRARGLTRASTTAWTPRRLRLAPGPRGSARAG